MKDENSIVLSGKQQHATSFVGIYVHIMNVLKLGARIQTLNSITEEKADMAEIGRSLHSTLLGPRPKVHTGKCQNCGYALELYEMDVRKSMKVMKCERCGLLHYYKKDIVGKWRLQKATKFELAR